MSKRSAVTGGTRFQYKEGPIALFVVLALAISMMVISAACGNDGDADLPSKTILVVGGLDTKVDPEATSLKTSLKAQKMDDDDADTIATALDTALSGDVDRPVVVNAIETRLRGLKPDASAALVKSTIAGDSSPLGDAKQKLMAQIDAALKTPTGQQHKDELEALRKQVDDAKTQADLDKVQTDLNAKLLAVLGSTVTTTSTATPSANKDFEDAKAKLLADIDARLKDATGSLKTDLEALRKQVADQAKTVQQLLDATKELTKKLQSSPSASATTPGSSTTTTPNNGGSVTTNTACGPITWGPAGPAPGAFTTDSPTQVREAIDVMKIPNDTKPYVTIHKACPGNDVPNGWIVGSSYTEAQGTKVSAGFLPAGTCIDYDPNVTTLSGTIEHTYKYHDRWWRSYLSTNGSATTLKMTVYWTPCEFVDGYKVTTTSFPSTSATTTTSTVTGFSCSNLPTKAEDLVTVFPNTAAKDWHPHPSFKHGWIYASTTAVTLKWVEGVHHFDYDGGSTTVGQSPPSGSAFTVWFCS